MTNCDNPTSGPAPWWKQPEALLLVLLVVGVYFSRMTTLPVRGEESRWARVAVQMIETGDWIVPRQQGLPFVDRPPLHSWTMALVGLARGQVDLVAVRLPSALAILATTLIVFAFCRTFLTRFGALAAAAAFATMGQVMQLGRLGENDAIFTCLITASLLTWHAAYFRGLPLAAWTAGYALAAAGALQKGIQAPAYFVAATGAFLLFRRDWRGLFSWRHLAGLAAFALVLGAWLVPFYLATDWESTIGMWTRTVEHRLATNGLLKHLVTYPFETFACLLPWSPMLLALLDPRVRRSLGRWSEPAQYVLVALLVTYPTVWFAAEGRGRYYMPLYPCVAILIGMLIEHCALAPRGSPARRGWDRFLLALAIIAPIGAVVVFTASVYPVPAFAPIAQAKAFALVFAIVACAAGYLLFHAWSLKTAVLDRAAVLALAAVFGLAYTGVVVNVKSAHAWNLAAEVAKVKRQIPNAQRLVSFGPVLHQFAYHYESLIDEHHWPVEAGQIAPDVEYFCFTYRPGDTAERRANGRSFYVSTTPGTLPVAWEKIAMVPCVRRRDPNQDQPGVIIGRIIRRNATAANTGDQPQRQ